MRFTGHKNDRLTIREGFLGQSMLIIPPAKWRELASHSFTRSLYVTAIGYYPVASYHDRKRLKGSHDYILLYCVDGKGYVEEDGKRTDLNANSFYILDKNKPHRYGSDPKKPWSIYWVHFNGELAGSFYKRYRAGADMGILVLAYDQKRIDDFDSLSAVAHEDLTELSMELHFLYLFRYITSFTHFANKADPDPSDSLSSVLLYMKNNVKQNCGISDFAALANYSVSRFSELFRVRTGYSPIQYFLQLKIHYACQYLSFSQMNVQQIAGELGFSDPYYFSRLFKKQIGKNTDSVPEVEQTQIGNKKTAVGLIVFIKIDYQSLSDTESETML